MTDAFRGLYRTIDGAYVTNSTMAFHVPEADYRAFGYEPAFDGLPWKESHPVGDEAPYKDRRIVATAACRSRPRASGRERGEGDQAVLRWNAHPDLRC